MERQISGQYQRIDAESADCGGIRNLRVDIDGERPLNVISGDLDGSTTSQDISGSFVFRVGSKIEKGETLELTCSNGEFQPNRDLFENIQIEVPLGSRSRDISVQWVTPSGDNVSGFFRKTSPCFRRLTIDHFYEEATEPLCAYDEEALESVSQRRNTLNITGAFAEAGVEATLKEGYLPIARPKSEDKSWSAQELQGIHFPTTNCTSKGNSSKTTLSNPRSHPVPMGA